MANNIVNGMMGLCVADALGVPVEFNTRERLTENPVVSMRGFGTHNQPIGTWSDDTSMSLCLVDSLSKGLNYEDIMKKFVKWFDEGAYTPYGDAFDIGIATRRALQRYLDGTKPLQCGGTSEYDNGNGSLMRILPILFYLQSRFGNDFFVQDEVFSVIHNVSALTHAHKRSLTACGINVSIAAKICEKSDLGIAVEEGISYAMTYYRKHPEFDSEFQYVQRLENKNFASLSIEQVKSSGYVVDTLEAAIWCLLTTSSYKDCVLKAVNLGEDTDSVAAVVGGLAGLHYGYESIPEEWLNAIARRDYIEDLCHTLHASFYSTAIEKLCKFLPYFKTATMESVCKWTPAEKTEEKQYITPYPTYDKTLLEFIDEVYNSNLLYTDYMSVTQNLHEELNNVIKTADLDLLRAILTYHVRAERFGDGAWATAVEEKVFLRILKRLKEISKIVE
jgi:ADP-ribosylglycohydrolase